MAFVPEQAPDGGVVRIRAVVARVARMELSGQRVLSIAKVRASLAALQYGRTP